MKQIRIEFPLCWGKSPNVYMSNPVYLKVVDNRTEAFLDKEFTQLVPQTEKKISVEVEVPEELGIIEVVPPRGITPVDDIGFGWVWYETNPNWKITGLKKVLIVLDKRTHEVPVHNEKPDFEEWKMFTSVGGEGQWWFLLPWALAIYATDTKTFAEFHWHSKLVKDL